MDSFFTFTVDSDKKPILKVVGVGNGGCNMLQRMVNIFLQIRINKPNIMYNKS